MSTSTIGLIKHSFFNKSLKNISPIPFTSNDFNLNQLRSEFATLYQLFLSNKEYWSTKPEIVFYINYIGDLLIRYYEKDYVRSELEKIKKQKKQLELYIKKHFIESNQETYNKLPDFLVHHLKTTAYEYTDSLTHISLFRAQIDTLSTIRSRWNYSRTFAVYIINFLQHSSISGLIREINILFGNQFSFADGINFLDQSREAMTIFGITLFAIRFFINLLLLIKHTILAYYNKELSTTKVLQQELEKRGFIMGNDIVWSIVSLLTSYNLFFKISSIAVPIIMGSFLIFDALLILANWFVDLKKYTARLHELMVQLKNAESFEFLLIKRQIDLIHDEWEAQKAYYLINVLGACTIVVSFAAAFLVSNPIGLAALALGSMLGNALYNTSNDYKKFIQAKMALRRENANGLIRDDAHHKELIVALIKEFNDSFNDFCKNLAFNIGGIAFIITAAVASWPIALCITALYVIYQITKTYEKQLASHNKVEVEHDVYRNMVFA